MTKPDPIRPFLVKEFTKNKLKGRYYWFDSTDSMIDLCTRPMSEYRDRVPFEIESTAGEWFGTRDMPTALKYFRYGWEEATEAIAIEDAALTIPRPIENEFTVYHDMAGGAVDVGAFVSGVPENMLQFEVQQRNKKTVKLLVNVGASGGTSSTKLKQRGLAIIGMIDWLERSGYRVRLDVCDTIGNGWGGYGDHHWCLAFCAKDFSQPLDLPRIAFMACSSAMLRRIFFGVEDLSPDFTTCFGHSYGSVIKVPDFTRAEYDYVFDYMTPVTIESVTQAIDYVISGNNDVEAMRRKIEEDEAAFFNYEPDELDQEALDAFIGHVEQSQTPDIQPADNMPLTSDEQFAQNEDPLVWVWDHEKQYYYPMQRKK